MLSNHQSSLAAQRNSKRVGWFAALLLGLVLFMLAKNLQHADNASSEAIALELESFIDDFDNYDNLRALEHRTQLELSGVRDKKRHLLKQWIILRKAIDTDAHLVELPSKPLSTPGRQFNASTLLMFEQLTVHAQDIRELQARESRLSSMYRLISAQIQKIRDSAQAQRLLHEKRVALAELMRAGLVVFFLGLISICLLVRLKGTPRQGYAHGFALFCVLMLLDWLCVAMGLPANYVYYATGLVVSGALIQISACAHHEPPAA